MNELVKRLVDLEAEVEYKTPPQPGQPDFCYTPGSIPVLISAPHGAAHTRNRRVKDEDEYTAGMARLVAERTGAHVLYAWRKSATDPNYAARTPFKLALAKIVRDEQIHFVLDLHGCSPRRSFGIALGSMHGLSCPAHFPAILAALNANGFSPAGSGLFRLDVDDTFPGGGGDHQETITRYCVRSLGVAALQVELNAHLRVPHRLPEAAIETPFNQNPLLIRRTIAALEAVVRAVVLLDGGRASNWG